MEKHIVKVLSVESLTHDVKAIKLDKPEGYTFTPGQATELAINKDGWDSKNRPFTFTGMNEDNYLEFSIKIYPDHNGVTKEINELKSGDSVIIHDVWGAIKYKGPGVFLAGGAGITPFIAIFRALEKEGKVDGNTLVFANKTEEDIIMKPYFENLLGDHFINILSDQEHLNYAHGFITKEFLQEKISDFSQNFYICGPKPMVKAMQQILKELGADDSIITVEV